MICGQWMVLCGYLVKVWLGTAMSSNPPRPELSLALLFCFSTHAPMYCGCSVAQTIRMSLQHNVQRWHLAERPPHPNFLSFSLLLTINIANVQLCINYSMVNVSVSRSVSVSVSIYVEEHIPKTLHLPSFVSVHVIFLSVLHWHG